LSCYCCFCLRQIELTLPIRRPKAAGEARGIIYEQVLLYCWAGSVVPINCYSTVTLFARLRGWSTSVPLRTAVW
jgi:hypothetical protein